MAHWFKCELKKIYLPAPHTPRSVVPADASVALEVAVEVGFRVRVRGTPVAMLDDRRLKAKVGVDIAYDLVKLVELCLWVVLTRKVDHLDAHEVGYGYYYPEILGNLIVPVGMIG